VAAFGLNATFPLAQWQLGQAAGWMLIGVVFILRDILVLQLLSLTRMKRAVVKGVLLLCLYYVGVVIVAAVFSPGKEASYQILALFTPFGAFSEQHSLWGAWSITGIALQIAASGYIIHLTNQRLGRKAVSPPILAAAQSAD